MTATTARVALAVVASLAAAAAAAPAVDGDGPKNLIKDGRLKMAAADRKGPEGFSLSGDSAWTYTGQRDEFADRGVAFHSGKDLDGDGSRAGSITQEVSGVGGPLGRWYRFSFRGLPEDGFKVGADGLFMKVDFFAHHGASHLDGVTRQLYPLVERSRKELGVNGPFGQGGAAVWRTYALDFKLPFPEVDQLRLTVGFHGGTAAKDENSNFYVTDLSLTSILEPAELAAWSKRPATTEKPKGLVPLGGRWYFRPESGTGKTGKTTFTAANADRLFYLDGRASNPFAENMTAWLRPGYLDRLGNVVTTERFVPDNVTVHFEDKTMVLRAKNLPNHPTAEFPEPFGGNHSYIQELDRTYFLPLEPVRHPKPVAMDKTNSNRALPMGAIGVAVNGVVFYNPFDAGMTVAVDLMDRCCGHPSPDNRYHYHKYPVCVKSPWADEGEEHSPLIGWAFDGFPIYGPYEKKGVMAKDSKENPLNEFNVHYDDVRGWHYHVTPGKFPYVIGGYWGVVDQRNFAGHGPRGGPMGRGGRPGKGPPRD